MPWIPLSHLHSHLATPQSQIALSGLGSSSVSHKRWNNDRKHPTHNAIWFPRQLTVKYSSIFWHWFSEKEEKAWGCSSSVGVCVEGVCVWVGGVVVDVEESNILFCFFLFTLFFIFKVELKIGFHPNLNSQLGAEFF